MKNYFEKHMVLLSNSNVPLGLSHSVCPPRSRRHGLHRQTDTPLNLISSEIL